MIIKKCSCGKEFTMKQWNQLHLVGHQDLDEDGDQALELRNCSCNTTIAIERTPEQRKEQT